MGQVSVTVDWVKELWLKSLQIFSSTRVRIYIKSLMRPVFKCTWFRIKEATPRGLSGHSLTWPGTLNWVALSAWWWGTPLVSRVWFHNCWAFPMSWDPSLAPVMASIFVVALGKFSASRAVARLRQRRRPPHLILGQESKSSRMQENIVQARIQGGGQGALAPPPLPPKKSPQTIYGSTIVRRGSRGAKGALAPLQNPGARCTNSPSR